MSQHFRMSLYDDITHVYQKLLNDSSMMTFSAAMLVTLLERLWRFNSYFLDFSEARYVTITHVTSF